MTKPSTPTTPYHHLHRQHNLPPSSNFIRWIHRNLPLLASSALFVFLSAAVVLHHHVSSDYDNERGVFFESVGGVDLMKMGDDGTVGGGGGMIDGNRKRVESLRTVKEQADNVQDSMGDRTLVEGKKDGIGVEVEHVEVEWDDTVGNDVNVMDDDDESGDVPTDDGEEGSIADNDGTDKNDTTAAADPPCPPYGCPIYPITLPSSSTVQNATSYHSYNYSTFTQKGRSHKVNQDRALLLFSPLPSPPGTFLMAIFDGHGDLGHNVSTFLLQHLPSLFYSKLHLPPAHHPTSPSDIREALHQTLTEIDHGLPPAIGNEGGSTAALIHYHPPSSTVTFASVGDSLCVLLSRPDRTILHRTPYDKPHKEEERERIEQMGGRVHTPPEHPVQARSVAFSQAKGEMVSLAMSRSVGDWEHVGVIATPHVESIVLPVPMEGRERGGGYIAACGSDGMFEARRPEFIARQLGEFGVGRVRHLMDLVVPKEGSLGYCDDVTLVALEIGG